MPTKTISFSDEQWEWIEKCAKAQGFSSGNEAVRVWAYQKAQEIQKEERDNWLKYANVAISEG